MEILNVRGYISTQYKKRLDAKLGESNFESAEEC